MLLKNIKKENEDLEKFENKEKRKINLITNNFMKKIFIIFVFSIISIAGIRAQNNIDYNNPKKYIIADISISGIEFLSQDALIMLSGLKIGHEIIIPGDMISNAIDKLWDQGLFSDVKISIVKVIQDSVFLDINLKEQPRLNKVFFYGITKSRESDLREKMELKIGKQVTDNMLRNTEIIIQEYYAEKGFPHVGIDFKLVDDTVYQNAVNLLISIDKKNKIKINDVIIRGNKVFTDKKIKRFLKDTKSKNFFRFWKASKYIVDNYENDKKLLIQKYNSKGYRDMRIIEDSIYSIDDKLLNIYIKIEEGNKFYFNNIEWLGNTKYSSEILSRILDLKKGDAYDQNRLQERLYTDEDAVGNLYYDDGYLFFSASPQELNISNDSVDIRIVINEGQQARINKIIIDGNTRTNEYVIRRELKTLPGSLFSKTDLINSVRYLAQIGNFDSEQLNPTPIPNQNDGTVDIQYSVVERPNDMFEISGGWGYFGFTGQVGITFNNFSMQNIFKPKYWDPLPIGDGQKFGISARFGGPAYQMYSTTFTNPWFGGKKANSFSISVYFNRMTNASYYNLEATQSFSVFGASIGLARRLKSPDENLIMTNKLAFEKYYMDGFRTYIDAGDGAYNIISLTNAIARKTTDNPLYTRRGSDISISLKTTPPYSLFFKNSWSPESDSVRYKWAELFKLQIKGAWYNQIVKDLVLSTRFEYGILGFYNKEIGHTPFESFNVGGSEMTYYSIGVDYISLRGYKDHSLNPANGSNLYSKYTIEMRYPILLKEMATLYVLGFVEAGNAWHDLNEFNPFSLYRSAGVGARLFVPMLGLVGLDFGYGFDPVMNNADANGWNTHFTFGQNF